MRLVRLQSVDALRAVAGAWDDLWQRSDVGLPLARAEMTAQFIEQFFPRARVECLAVEAQGELIAGLPLVSRKLARVLTVGGLPESGWGGTSEILVDRSADYAQALDLLLDSLPKLGWPLVWLNEISLDAAGPQLLLEALERRGACCALLPLHQVGQIEIDGGASDAERRLSKNLRRKIRKGLRGLEQLGPVEIEWRREFTAHEVDAAVREAFEVEARSWKGAAGGSVLQSPQMFEFFLRQARQLASWGQFELWMLRSGGRPIAFDFGYRAKGVFYSHKVSYDAAYAEFGPGHLLQYHQLARYADEGDCRRIDCLGPLNEATARWATAANQLARLAIAMPGVVGQTLVRGYRAFGPAWRSLRGKGQSEPLPLLSRRRSDEPCEIAAR